MNKNLVIVRAGDKSLHLNWLAHLGQDQNWDLALSYFDSQDNPFPNSYKFLHKFKGSKWQGIDDFIKNYGSELSQYNYFWMPDDDLFTDSKNINKFFELVSNLDYDISQPALTLSSYVSHVITLQRPYINTRETNFVEIMAPCFSKKALNLVKDTFSYNKSGWGLEWVWLEISRQKNLKMGIVDEAPIYHTRRVGSAGHGGSSDPLTEMNDIFQKYDINPEKPINLNQKIKNWRAFFYPQWVLSKINKLLIGLI
jgi:hypothetical protein